MTTTKQFWALFKFQMTVNPFIWFIPISLGIPIYFTHQFLHDYHPDLGSLLQVQNLFLVGFFGAMIIAPERFQFAAANAAWSTGLEFLLTRAINRRLLYRARTMFFYLLLLIVPVISILISYANPDLKVTEYSDKARQQCLTHIPGSVLQSDTKRSHAPLILIAGGNILIEKWHLWLFLLTAASLQFLILMVYAMKYRLIIFYGIFIGCIFAPLIWAVYSIGKDTASIYERVFFVYAAHQTIFWVFTILVLFIAQFWGERRWTTLEH